MGEDDKLSIPKTQYTGKQLRIDGYYYLNRTDGTIATRYFFYFNGILLEGVSTINKGVDQTEEAFKDGSYYSSAKNDKLSWGVFKIDNDQIQFEKWYPSSGGPTHAYVRAGKILNETTFQITESYRMQGGNKTEVSAKDEVYHFKQFSPKPDSANVFVP